jgi:hypothetical protein
MNRVEVEAVRRADDIWDLIITQCPYCSKRHTHGGGDGSVPFYGPRVSHCRNLAISREDELIPVPRAAKPALDGLKGNGGSILPPLSVPELQWITRTGKEAPL